MKFMDGIYSVPWFMVAVGDIEKLETIPGSVMYSNSLVWEIPMPPRVLDLSHAKKKKDLRTLSNKVGNNLSGNRKFR